MEEVMETVKLTDAQAAYLADNRTGRPHGLVQKGCLMYRWGSNAFMGYVLTPLGKRSLAAYRAEKRA